MIKWHLINETTKIATHNLYVFISVRILTNKYRFQLLSNNGTVMDTWRSTFRSHKAIEEQVEIMIESNNFN